MKSHAATVAGFIASVAMIVAALFLGASRGEVWFLVGGLVAALIGVVSLIASVEGRRTVAEDANNPRATVGLVCVNGSSLLILLWIASLTDTDWVVYLQVILSPVLTVGYALLSSRGRTRER